MKVIEKSSCLVKLLQAIDKGWEIDEPVLFGSMGYLCPGARSSVYHVVLRNKKQGKTILLSLSPSSELLAFLSEHSLRVNSL